MKLRDILGPITLYIKNKWLMDFDLMTSDITALAPL